MSNTKGRQNIVIVGGGNAGISTFIALAGHLDATVSNLILITPRSYFTHLPATLRMVVTSEGRLEDTALMPFGNKHNGPNKQVLNAKVTSIVDSETKGRYVVLENGDKIDFSVLVLTPGSIWEGPINFPDKKEEHLEWIDTWREKFGKANNIVLVGGGAVGLGKYCVSYPLAVLFLTKACLSRTRWRVKGLVTGMRHFQAYLLYIDIEYIEQERHHRS